METAYVGVQLWARAVNEAQSVEPKKVRRALLNQHLKGPGGDVRIDADTHYCFRTPRIGQIQADGQFKIVWSASGPLQPVASPVSRTGETGRAFPPDCDAWGGTPWAPSEAVAFRSRAGSGGGPKRLW